jgi:cytochrome oxidase Cu insertion factor (SCO1/SenC/PrrC family)
MRSGFRWSVLLAAGLLAAGCYQGDGARSKKISPPPGTGQVKEGVGEGLRAPEITGIDADGKQFKLSDYRGKVVLLDFWFER